MWRVYNQHEWLFAVITGVDMEKNVQKTWTPELFWLLAIWQKTESRCVVCERESERKPKIINVLRERLDLLNPLLLLQTVLSSSRTLGSAVLHCGKTCRNPPTKRQDRSGWDSHFASHTNMTQLEQYFEPHHTKKLKFQQCAEILPNSTAYLLILNIWENYITLLSYIFNII